MRLPTLRAKFFLMVLPLVLVFFAVYSAAAGYLTYRDMERDLETRIKNITAAQSRALADSVWQIQNRLIQNQLESMMLYPAVAGVELAASGVDLKLSIGQVPGPENRTGLSAVKEDVVYTTNRGSERIGVLAVYYHKDVIKRALWSKFLQDSLLLALLLAAVMASALAANRLTVGLPLSRFLRSIRGTEAGRGNVRVDWSSTDELGEVIDAYNQLIERLTSSEERLRLAFEATDYFWWEIDLISGQTVQSSMIREITSLSSEERYQDFYEMMRRLVHPEDLPALLADLDRHFTGASPVHNARFRAKNLNGKYIWLHSMGRVMTYDKDGRPKGFIGISKDVTREHEAEEALRRAVEAAEEANRAKTDFTAGVSHEIRTHMNAISGMAELLAESELDGRQQRYVHLFKTAGDDLLRITNDLLDASKIEAGLMKHAPEPMDLGRLMDDVHRVMYPQARAKGLSFVRRIDLPGPVWVLADPIRLRQILINLLNNSIKFTDQGEINLSIRQIRERGGGHGPFLFTVADTGPGIPFDQQTLVFERYTQVETAPGSRRPGSGLGLTVVKHLIGLMDGFICIDSEPGRGTSFSFTARLKPAIPPGDREEVRAAPPAGPGRPLRILAVDDHDVNLELIVLFLEDCPHQVDTALDGGSALDILKAGSYDLVLLDMEMPVMDGFQTAREFRAYEKKNNIPPTPIIALTAYAFPEDERRTLEAGCDAHLAKPISRGKLLEAMTEVLVGQSPAPIAGLAGQTAPASPPGNIPNTVRLDPRFRTLAPKLKVRLEECLNQAAENCRERDFSALQKNAHSAAGLGMNFGLTVVAELASKLEQAVEEGNRESARELIAEIQVYMGRIEFE